MSRTAIRPRASAIIAACAVALVLASCGTHTQRATYVGQTTAVVAAELAHLKNQRGVYWFEYSNNGGFVWAKGPSHSVGPYSGTGLDRLHELVTGLRPGVKYLYRICTDFSQPNTAKVCTDADGGIDGPFNQFRTQAAQGCHATLYSGRVVAVVPRRTFGRPGGVPGAGTYAPHSRIVINRDITLQPVPGATVRIEGELAIEADGATVRDIYLRGTEEIRVLDVKANNVTVEHMDITRHTSNDTSLQGIIVGGSSERALNPVIRNNKIYGVGSRQSEVGCCAHDHAVYCQNASGLVAEGNWVFRNRDGYGFHLYSDCDNARIRFNVSANNDHGDVIAGNGSRSSSGNLFEYNIYSNNSGWYRSNRTGVGCSEPGSGNVVRNINVYPAAGTDCPFGFTT